MSGIKVMIPFPAIGIFTTPSSGSLDVMVKVAVANPSDVGVNIASIVQLL